MTSFGWKRKIGEKVSQDKSEAFKKEASSDVDPEVASGDIDWLTPKRRVIQLEDVNIKWNRLVQEGSTLAENDRYWEALQKWDAALKLNDKHPENAKIFEMKSQAYLCLGELFPSVNAAEKAVEMRPCWWMAYQTLGRAHLGLGEVRLALKSFQRAIHLNPSVTEVWEEDLKWAYQLLLKKKTLSESETEAESHAGPILRNLQDCESQDTENAVAKRLPQRIITDNVPLSPAETNKLNIDGLPSGYVVMR